MAAYRWAKSWDLLNSNQKFILVMIGDRFNEEQHRSWPSRETLARDTCMSVRSVVRCLKALEEQGLIEIEPWINASTGSQMSNRYYLPLYDAKSSASTELPVRVFAGYGNSGKWEYEDAP
jgi:DNA-binding transcriptional MocR family regulator